MGGGGASGLPSAAVVIVVPKGYVFLFFASAAGGEAPRPDRKGRRLGPVAEMRGGGKKDPGISSIFCRNRYGHSLRAADCYLFPSFVHDRSDGQPIRTGAMDPIGSAYFLPGEP